MEIDHRSDEYEQALMPHTIFFTQTGNAVHGTFEERSLGRAASHGCVRLSRKNAATLWSLVTQEKMAHMSVVVKGDIPGAEPSTVASAGPRPLNANDSRPGSPAAPSIFWVDR
jgi:hypothetical protein